MALMLTMAIDDSEEDGRLRDELFIEPHVYRKPRKIDMGPVCRAAYAAVAERRALGDSQKLTGGFRVPLAITLAPPS
jgi:hypothetical protein